MKIKLVQSLLVLALMTLATSGAVLAAAEVAKTVDVKQALVMHDAGALLLDVREVSEYAESHVAGSTLIPLGQLKHRLLEIGADKSKPVALICRSGRRSAEALKLLEQAGFSAAVNVGGGMIAWQKAGLPVVTGAQLR
ncbi:MAG: rhodanese-like domain-containing protein [Undibacterium sp.]|nr:rhodanese-like domain-containing protein [Undibacterium sp.]